MFIINYGQIRKYDVANGLGIRTTIFVTGCHHDCYNCFNKEYQDFCYGNTWTEEETMTIIKNLDNKTIRGLSILGGEPMEHPIKLLEITNDIRSHLREDQDIWLWSGYTFEQILINKDMRALLDNIDVLIDGKFVQTKKDLTLRFRGSSNQRIIDVQQSLKRGEVVLWKEVD